MKTTPPTDPAPPVDKGFVDKSFVDRGFVDRGFGELRCRRYLFDRDFGRGWEDPVPPVSDAGPSGGAAPRPGAAGPERH